MATKFMLSAGGETLQDFLPGRFRLRIFSLGAGGAAAAAAPGEVSAAALPPAMTEEAQKVRVRLRASLRARLRLGP